MLKQSTIDIVKSTAPILAENGELLTKHFYKRMFSNNPEVLPFFNQSNQQSGTQQRALAGAITAYATHIDNLEVLNSAVNTIVQKHVSLQIKEEHYPIVGENLIESIKEVLGDLATKEVVTAWSEAYGFLAKILIDAEKAVYESNANKKGGWEGFRDFIVSKKVKESDNIASFYLSPKDAKELPEFLAGQYITVQVPTKDGSTTMRNYSLSDVSGKDYFRISIKKEVYENKGHNGYVSNFFHNNVKENDVIKVAPPCGEFILKKDSKKPLVLLSGGVGITPILNMLKTSLNLNAKREVILIHGSYNPSLHAFKNDVDELSNNYANLKVHYCYNDINNEYELANNESIGLITEDVISKLCNSKDADYYFCGPKIFMANIYKILTDWNIAQEQINFEFFGPKEDLQKEIAK
jgi:nitric oxide dioxygenase